MAEDGFRIETGEAILTPLNLARVMGDVNNINDPVFQQALQSRILCDDSTIRTAKNQLIELIHQQHKNVVTQNVKISVPSTIRNEDLDVIKVEYGTEFYIDQSKSLPYAPHAMCKALNKIEHYKCLKMIGYKFNRVELNRPVDLSSAFAICVGANSMFYLANELPFIHSCCPHLDFDDLVRKHFTNHHLSIFECHSEYQEAAQKSLLDPNNHGLRCNLRAENCDMSSPFCMFIYSSCNMNQENMVRIMENHNSRIGVGVALFDYRMLLYPLIDHGELEYHQMYWRVVKHGGRLRIRFTFRDEKMQKNYEHDYHDYLSFLKVGAVSGREKGVNYLFTIVDVKLEAVYFMIFKNTYNILGGPTSFSIPLSRTFDGEKLVVKSLKLMISDTGARYFVPKLYLDIPTEFIYKVIVHLTKARETTFNFKTAYDIGALYNSDIVIGGLQMGVPKDRRIPVTDLQWVVFALMAQVYKDNYDVGDANKLFRADIDVARRNEGFFLLRGLKNLYWRFWPFGNAAALRQYEDATNDIDFELIMGEWKPKVVDAPDVGILCNLWDKLFTMKAKFDIGICRGMGLVTLREFIDDFEGSNMVLLDGIIREQTAYDIDGNKIDEYLEKISVPRKADIKPLRFEKRELPCLESENQFEVIKNSSVGSCFYIAMIDAGLTDESVSEIKTRLLHSKHISHFPEAHIDQYKKALTDPTVLPIVSMMALVAMEYGVSICVHSHESDMCHIVEGGCKIFHFITTPEHIEAMQEKPKLPYIPIFEFVEHIDDSIDLVPFLTSNEDPNDPIKRDIFESGKYPSNVVKLAKRDADPLSNLPRVVCRSEHKLLEILHRCDFELYGTFVGLCEGPGGWIKVALDAGCDVYANTYNNIAKGGIPFKYSKFDKEVHVLRGHYASSDGDITVVNNQDAIIREMKKVRPGGVDFVTSDGMPGNNKKYDSTERNLLFISEIKVALNILKDQGTYIIKLCDIHDKCTMALLALLLRTFSFVKVMRPTTSKPFSGEVFAVCRGYNKSNLTHVMDKITALGVNPNAEIYISRWNMEVMKEMIAVLNGTQGEGLMLLRNCCEDRLLSVDVESSHAYTFQKPIFDMFKRVCSVRESGISVQHRDIIYNPSFTEPDTVKKVGGVFSYESISVVDKEVVPFVYYPGLNYTTDLNTKGLMLFSSNTGMTHQSIRFCDMIGLNYENLLLPPGSIEMFQLEHICVKLVIVAHVDPYTFHKTFENAVSEFKDMDVFDISVAVDQNMKSFVEGSVSKFSDIKLMMVTDDIDLLSSASVYETCLEEDTYEKVEKPVELPKKRRCRCNSIVLSTSSISERFSGCKCDAPVTSFLGDLWGKFKRNRDKKKANSLLKTSQGFKIVGTELAEMSIDESAKASSRKPRDVSAWYVPAKPLVKVSQNYKDVKEDHIDVIVKDKKDQSQPEENKFNVFFGPSSCLSPISKCILVVDGTEFTSLMCAYHYCKAKYHGEVKIFETIKHITAPLKAKSLTKDIVCSKSWDEDKIVIMTVLYYFKISKSDIPLRKGDVYVEAGPDRFWSTGLAYENPDNLEPKKWLGKNLVGKILTVMANNDTMSIMKVSDMNSILSGISKAKLMKELYTEHIFTKPIEPLTLDLNDEDKAFVTNAAIETRDIVIENDRVQLQNHINYAIQYKTTNSPSAFFNAIKSTDECIGVSINYDGGGLKWKYPPIVAEKYNTYFCVENNEFVKETVARKTKGTYIVSSYSALNFGEVISNNMTKHIDCGLVFPRVSLIAAAFGTGKTTFVINNAIDCIEGKLVSRIRNNDGSLRRFVVMTATAGARENLIYRVKKIYGEFAQIGNIPQENIYFRTFDSLFIHGTRTDEKIDDMWVDEALMAHCGDIFIAATMYNSEKIYNLGDFLQVPYFCRIPDYRVGFQSLLNVGKITETLSISYRCPLDVVSVWSGLYRDFSSKFGKTMNLKGANEVVRSMSYRHAVSLENEIRRYDVQYICMNQSEKKALNAWLYHGFTHQQRKTIEKTMSEKGVRNPCTVHEYQGSQHDHIVLFRIETKDAYAIFTPSTSDYGHNPHILVATTRHLVTFEYVTLSSTKDGIIQIIEKAKDMSLSEIMSHKVEVKPVGRIELAPSYQLREVRRMQLPRIPVGTLSYNVRETYGYSSRMIFEGRYGLRISRSSKHFLANMPSEFFRSPRATQKELMREVAKVAPKNVEMRIDVTKAVERGYTELLSDILYSTLKKNNVKYKSYSAIYEKNIPLNMVRAEYTEIDSALPNDEIVVAYPAADALVYFEDENDPNIGILQDFLVEEMGTCPISQKNITDVYNSSDMVIDVEGVIKVNTSKFAPTTRRFANMTPKLNGPMPAKKPRSLQETLYAFKKRNGAVPQLQMEVDFWETSTKMLDKFVESFLDSDKLSIVNVNPVRFSAEDLLAASANQKENVIQTLEFDKMLYHRSGNRVSYEIKRIAKPPDTKDDVMKYAAPQTIVYPSKEVNLTFCVIWRELRERVTAALNNSTFIYSQLAPEEFARVLSASVPPKSVRGKRRLELDMAKYDKSQGMLALLFECKLMRFFKIPEYYVTLWWNTHLVTLLKDPVSYFRSRVYFQRRSGDASTFFGNTTYLMACLATIYDMSTCQLKLFSGDDSVLIGDHFDDYSAKMAALFNLEVKFIDKYTCIYFCSKFLLEIDDQNWAFVPNPRKLAIKLCRSDLVNDKHVEFYHISFADHVKVYGNNCIQHKLDMAYSERYNRKTSILPVIQTLLRLADIKNFKNLYYVADGDIIDEQRYMFNIER